MLSSGIKRFFDRYWTAFTGGAFLVITFADLYLFGHVSEKRHYELWDYAAHVAVSLCAMFLAAVSIGLVSWWVVEKIRKRRAYREAMEVVTRMNRNGLLPRFSPVGLSLCNCEEYGEPHYHLRPHVIITATAMDNAWGEFKERDDAILEKVSAKYCGEGGQTRDRGYSIGGVD